MTASWWRVRLRFLAVSLPSRLSQIGVTFRREPAEPPEVDRASRLWRSDGTPGGTLVVSATATIDLSRSWEPLTHANGMLYFGGGAGQVWQSDGTAAGTVRIADICSGACYWTPWPIATSGTHLYFGADDGMSGRELWAVDLDLVFKNGFE